MAWVTPTTSIFHDSYIRPTPRPAPTQCKIALTRQQQKCVAPKQTAGKQRTNAIHTQSIWLADESMQIEKLQERCRTLGRCCSRSPSSGSSYKFQGKQRHIHVCCPDTHFILPGSGTQPTIPASFWSASFSAWTSNSRLRFLDP